MKPAGAPFMAKPGRHNPLGRHICWKQGVPYSHTGCALGNGLTLDFTYPYAKLRTEMYWDGRVDWWEPDEPFSLTQARELRSLAYFCEGLVKYSIWEHLMMFAVRGVPAKRGHGVVCTTGLAGVYLIIRGFDFSGQGMPWRVDLRTELSVLQNGPFRRLAA